MLISSFISSIAVSISYSWLIFYFKKIISIFSNKVCCVLLKNIIKLNLVSAENLLIKNHLIFFMFSFLILCNKLSFIPIYIYIFYLLGQKSRNLIYLGYILMIKKLYSSQNLIFIYYLVGKNIIICYFFLKNLKLN